MGETVYFLARVIHRDDGTWRVAVSDGFYPSWEEAESVAQAFGLGECEIHIVEIHGQTRKFRGVRATDADGKYDWQPIEE